MDKELQQQLMNGDAINLCIWMRRQFPQRLRAVVASHTLPYSTLMLCKDAEIRGFHALVAFLAEELSDGDFETAISLVFDFYKDAGHDINAKVDLKPYRRKRFGTTPLLQAIQSKKLRLAKALVAAGADVNLSDSSGFTPLHWLVLSSTQMSSVADTLVEAGADLSLFSLEARPLLHLAVDEGRLDIVQFALQHGCDVNVSSAYDVIKEEQWAAITRYHIIGDVEKESKLLTALSRAVRMRKIQVLQYMLRQNARVSVDDLHFCILEGDTKVACMLISHFDDETIRNDLINGRWALLSLGRRAFFSNYGEDLSAFTIQLLWHYGSCGWDITKHAYSLLQSINANPLVWLLNSFDMYISSLTTHLCSRLCHATPDSDKKKSGDCDMGRFAYLVAKLCAAGFNADNFRMERILLTRPCLMVSFPCVLKNLHWAGAILGNVEEIDQTIRSWVAESENHEDFSKCLKEFLDWYIQETSGPPTLFALCSRNIRMQLNRQNLKEVLVDNLGMPPIVARSVCQKVNCCCS